MMADLPLAPVFTVSYASDLRERVWFMIKCLNRLRHMEDLDKARLDALEAVDPDKTFEERQAAFDDFCVLIGEFPVSS